MFVHFDKIKKQENACIWLNNNLLGNNLGSNNAKKIARVTE